MSPKTAIKNKITSKIGLHKQNNTSLFYGVRVDKRQINSGIVTWYRSEIYVTGTRVYLGAFLYEEFAAYAFNVAFNILNTSYYKIENNVTLLKSDCKLIEDKVNMILLNKGYISTTQR